MSFAGLQKRLQKKVASTAAVTGASSSSEANLDPAPFASTIYDAATREARANHEERKRQRSPDEEKKLAKNVTVNDGAGHANVPSEQLPAERARPKNLTETEFLERRCLAEEVVLQCAGAMLRSMEPATTTSSTAVIKNESEAYYLSGLPAPLCQFLEQRLQRSSNATAMSIDACEEEEHELLSALKVALKSTNNEQVAFPQHLESLIIILRTLWLALCWHWAIALCGTEGSESRENGWSYNVYLLSRHALPDVVLTTRGRDVTLALEAWKVAYHVRQNVLDFLAYILHDVGVVLRFSQSDDSRTHEESRIVPLKLVDSIFQMVQHLRRRDFAACRQIYVDLTMGTANWKLGLFSGGEVHMRRSMERIERRRIEHLLHNERAVRILHVLRELVDFVQKNEVALLHSGIFATERPKKEHS
ncbi:hypothetical protein TraAM80_10176 [Trypanosoma rangeli]|uniref:Pre-mRNA-splicing factor 18 n=1 Tax=Trypanosoma rangeli TaxID=5698 RepID=A0A422MQV2_TRYRA|nr:uncharacterized protein TraAM80_10176 [Trypanosoma rangeli]RNE95571.1 hypothetical protein TraAM80_10176 [Trypanosoma rangeli]|eukprot:RNE95571.1 hypothetical protein TraAM80_10176 [Trypanosoma rangeli]